MRAGRMFQQACIAKSSTCEKIFALQVSSAISPATKTIELLLIFLRRLAGPAPQGFANTVLWDSDDREPACRGIRSEEHTSELQSRLHLVCRLLLEKKKKYYTKQHY